MHLIPRAADNTDNVLGALFFKYRKLKVLIHESRNVD